MVMSTTFTKDRQSIFDIDMEMDSNIFWIEERWYSMATCHFYCNFVRALKIALFI